jgi:hypothetical protein
LNLLVVLLIFTYIIEQTESEYIERVTKRHFQDQISSIDRSPRVTCPFSEAGYLEVNIDPKSVPAAVAWLLPKKFYSGKWTLGSAGIYKCPSSGKGNPETFYPIITDMPWVSWLGGKMKTQLASWKLQDGKQAIQAQEMVWIEEMMNGLGKWLWPNTEVILHYRPSEIVGDLNVRVRMRVKGSIVFDKSIPRDQFDRVVDIFKQNCFIKTI